MGAKTRTIELDEAAAVALEACANDRGVSVSELVAELIPIAADSEVIAELERRWRAVQAGDETVSQADVESCLRTWGTPAFRPWAER